MLKLNPRESRIFSARRASKTYIMGTRSKSRCYKNVNGDVSITTSSHDDNSLFSSNSSSNCPSSLTYLAERIVGKVMSTEGIKYYVKWFGFPPEQNTWEPLDHLKDAIKLIEQFESETSLEKALRSLEEDIQPERNFLNNADDTFLKNTTDGQDDTRLIPEEIVGATDTDGEVKFLIRGKRQNVTVERLVPSKYLRFTHPQLVIQFYEKHSQWVDPDDVEV